MPGFYTFRLRELRFDEYLCLGQILARMLIAMCRVQINLEYPISRFPKFDKSQIPCPSCREISGYAMHRAFRRIHGGLSFEDAIASRGPRNAAHWRCSRSSMITPSGAPTYANRAPGNSLGSVRILAPRWRTDSTDSSTFSTCRPKCPMPYPCW